MLEKKNFEQCGWLDAVLPEREEMGMKKFKQGIMFSVSVMLLALAMISFAYYLSEQALKGRSTVSSLLEIDRAGDTYSNMERQLAQIASGAINISVSNSTVLLSQSLPWNSEVATYLQRFELFEENKSDLNVSIGTDYLSNGSFVIQPVNVTISQGEGTFSITPLDTQESSGMLSSYNLNLTLPSGSFDDVAWENFSNSSGDNMSVRVRVTTSDYSHVWPANYTYFTLDKHNQSSFNITLAGALVGRVSFSTPAALIVQYSGGNIGLKASVGFSTPVYVETNDDISVRSSVNKTGRLRIA